MLSVVQMLGTVKPSVMAVRSGVVGVRDVGKHVTWWVQGGLAAGGGREHVLRRIPAGVRVQCVGVHGRPLLPGSSDAIVCTSVYVSVPQQFGRSKRRAGRRVLLSGVHGAKSCVQLR